ncbi:MAG: hypothetical protein LBO68_02640, partial [Synergistaceae bacterium]|nr:hypothetical protein [Synergistaceae bacterium]
KDLQITRIPGGASDDLSLDITLPGGRQAVTMRVFDVAYTAEKLADTVVNSPALLAQIPPPMLVFRKSSMDTEYEIDSAGKDGSRESNYFAGTGGSTSSFQGDDILITKNLSLKEVGSYLVKVELFDVAGGERKRRRLVEEAFFQISSPDS